MNVPTGSEYDPAAPWNELPKKMRVCWNCEGSGTEANLVPIRGLIDAYKEQESECSVCLGDRELPANEDDYNE